MCAERVTFAAVSTPFERNVDAARSAYERNDPNGALRRLDAARRDALKRRNEEQLRRVLDFADGVITRDERTEIGRENLIYAIRQNLRQVSRRRAYEEEKPWVDPFPDLESPRAQTRTFMSRGVKFWIAAGIVLALLAAAGFVAALIAGAFETGGDRLALNIHNDTSSPVRVRWCDSAGCGGDFDPRWSATLEPGEAEIHKLPAADVVDLFVLEDTDGDVIGCLPVRVDRTWADLADKEGVVSVSLSQASSCPGDIVTPEPVL
jgi:hypothetical protein